MENVRLFTVILDGGSEFDINADGCDRDVDYLKFWLDGELICFCNMKKIMAYYINQEE